MGWRVAKEGWRKGPWTPAEDSCLWSMLHCMGRGDGARLLVAQRNGKSCRLRWVNYLRPGLKKGQLSPQEEGIIIELHALWGNKFNQDQKVQVTMSNTTSSESEVYDRITELPQAALQETSDLTCRVAMGGQQQPNPCVMAQDVTRWWDTISEEGLWSGFVWNVDQDHPNQDVMEQSFSPCF
ncbi:hypothetical protein L1987_44052 [Smallanthus sonchifolius]|uniref:Uncharacterized protein n=1 Tax=Smallanthus sonchifolius TaxID=185202 RepID=A0ACB9GMT4_9ASTR|nr:hypothetical protein L1987_44052 [Smallanthus sonchifolius]